MNELDKYLVGRDVRSIAQVEKLLPLIQSQSDFNKFFKYLYSEDRLITMRAVDAIEKITADKPELLAKYKKDILQFLKTAIDKEFKWHLALLVSRLDLTKGELKSVWQELSNWAVDKKESKIVRVNSIQSLFDLAKKEAELEKELKLLVLKVNAEKIPSLTARLKKLKI